MDIFSLGCVIAELWLEGTPLFNLSELLSYRNASADANRFNPASRLAKIDNEQVRRLILHMIQLDPEERHSAGQYVKSWTSILFPSYFHDLHTYMANLMDLEPDDRIKIVAQDFDVLFAKFSSTAAAGADKAFAAPATPGALARSNTATSAEMLRSLAEPVKLNQDDTVRAEQLEARRLTALSTAPSFQAMMAVTPIGDAKPVDSKSAREQLIKTEQLILELENPSNPAGDTSEQEVASMLQSLEEENQSITVSDDPTQPEIALRKALSYHKKKLAEAKASDDKSGLMAAFESLSSICRGLGDFDRSRRYNDKLRGVASNMSSFAALQRAYTLSGVTEFETGELQAATKHFEEAFKLADSLGDRLAQCQLASRLAEIYTTFQLFDKVAFYQQQYDVLVQEVGAARAQSPSVVNRSSPNIRPPNGTGNSISFHSKSHTRSLKSAEPQAPGFVIILSMICSLLRNLKEQQTRLLALETMSRIAPHVDDDIRLQRMVPYIVSLLEANTRNAPSASLVTAHAIKALTSVIALVRNFPPSDARSFSCPSFFSPLS